MASFIFIEIGDGIMEELLLLLALSQKQEQLLSEETLDMDKFDTIVNKKERIIEQLKQQDPEGMRVFNEEEKTVLLQITEIDKKNKEAYMRHYEKTRQQLKRIRAGKKQNLSYANPYSMYEEEGRFFDKRER